MNIDTLLTTTFILLPLVFAFICLYYAFLFLKRARQLEDTPTSKIRSAALGFVELSGIAKPMTSQEVVGQLSHDPVAWSRYQIEARSIVQTPQGTESYWTIIEQGAHRSAFVLEDDTGKALIFPDKAEIIPAETIIWYGSTPTAPLPSKTFWQWFFASSSGRFRFKEQRILIDSTITIRGMFSTLGQNPDLLEHYPHLNKNLPILSATALPIGYHYVISNMPAKRLSRQYRLKAMVFFLGFLLFSVIIINSTFPVVKKMLEGF